MPVVCLGLINVSNYGVDTDHHCSFCETTTACVYKNIY